MPPSDIKQRVLKMAYLMLLWLYFDGKLEESREEADDSDADEDETIALANASDEMLIEAFDAMNRLMARS
ncbi:hypothetical protein BO85DRAFT_450852 [Aspergillus piperis CBS 112811]|uniref:Uncharacterized protein n=1 Tax=Aspergillus piperis CBS 112811 TaxID=1448313 RepID=A0A8G1QYZ0_9EURO|nr:hypothetical protein BO85DRAFT_450852 [Aspergillus piperis CBS 112811]RAH56208.1 hypothetical protein BO85DRAFT_450852 [Aspergillus piperis CBS 112811]